MTTPLLDTDGSASIATFMMCSHHAFRRDLACFARALAEVTPTDTARLSALAQEWGNFHGGLHGHHTMEDTAIFPDLAGKHPSIASAIATLGEQHQAIDPLLVGGNIAFTGLAAQLPTARHTIAQLSELLATHLELEEATVIPHLRTLKTFDAPPDEAMLAMYADGFAWSTAGIADSVLDRVWAMLPEALVAKLPAARAAFAERCRKAWGYTHATASTTSSPS